MIELNGICKTYTGDNGRQDVLEDISLHIRPGEIVALTGRSGSGKSMLLNILGCLDTPNSGSYRFDGQLVDMTSESQLAQIRNKRIGLVFANAKLLPKLTTLENINLPLRYGRHGSDLQPRTAEVSELLNLGSFLQSYPRELSLLNQKKVAIARALINQPSVLLADEPTGNLDSPSAEIILATLQQLNEQLGTTVVIATHDQEVAVCTRRSINLRDGKLISDKVVIQTRLRQLT